MMRKRILHEDPKGWYKILECTDYKGNTITAITYPHGKYIDIKVTPDFFRMFRAKDVECKLCQWIRMRADGTFTDSPINMIRMIDEQLTNN